MEAILGIAELGQFWELQDLSCPRLASAKNFLHLGSNGLWQAKWLDRQNGWRAKMLG